MSTPEPPFTAELDLLTTGELGIVGRVLESSNLTFVVELTSRDAYGWAIYKPQLGERPLWDFAPGLHARERAAHLLSEWLGWHLVPPTIVRDDGPLGIGSLQWYVENDGEHYFTLFETGDLDCQDQLRRIAVFDVLTNNTDRKAGHVLRDADAHLWAIDHGLCFSAEPKLRTVIWEFADEEIDADLLADLAPLADALPPELDELKALLDPEELRQLRRRARRLLQFPFLPHETSHYQYPWPLI